MRVPDQSLGQGPGGLTAPPSEEWSFGFHKWRCLNKSVERRRFSDVANPSGRIMDTAGAAEVAFRVPEEPTSVPCSPHSPEALAVSEGL